MDASGQSEATLITPSAGVYAETVLSVEHYTDRLFRFRITRPAGFRFRSGEFSMIGLMIDGKPTYRAYSIASPAWEDHLEFFSIKVAHGPLTSHLQRIKAGDRVLLRRKPTGTLVLDALTPGQRLYLFSTGTGIAPFASLIRDPVTYENFEEVILTHTCRQVAELKYGFDLIKEIHEHEFLANVVGNRLRHYATVTRDEFLFKGRITDVIKSGKFYADLGVPQLDSLVDRGMICGSAAMLKETKALLEEAGLTEGANSKAGEFVVERAFVD
ncbi:ferredoxin--NADP(+) reductase (plasmid) [Agrobacterium vitis]|uniref:ferredoxin--NADP reductase n=1 Tax=Agrobacterium vitis TaxID=373 RepID=UPI0015DA676A|nr:ferredoxin--NADP reductase [Agrobacterium vitis]BCH67472.1 ferredoxin--NADP(+) reductase [Agrobacterium vitis]